MSHIFARGRGMGPISHGIINADPAAVQVLMIKIRSREKKLNLVTKERTTPFNSFMHFVASSTVLIRIKPKPRDLSD